MIKASKKDKAYIWKTKIPTEFSTAMLADQKLQINNLKFRIEKHKTENLFILYPNSILSIHYYIMNFTVKIVIPVQI